MSFYNKTNMQNQFKINTVSKSNSESEQEISLEDGVKIYKYLSSHLRPVKDGFGVTFFIATEVFDKIESSHLVDGVVAKMIPVFHTDGSIGLLGIDTKITVLNDHDETRFGLSDKDGELIQNLEMVWKVVIKPDGSIKGQFPASFHKRLEIYAKYNGDTQEVLKQKAWMSSGTEYLYLRNSPSLATLVQIIY